MSARTGKDPRPYFAIRVLDRAFDVLDALLEGGSAVGMREIAQHVGLSKSTVHRLLLALGERRLVARNEDTGKYRLGPRLLRYAAQILDSADIIAVARPMISRVAAESAEGVRIHVWDHDRVVVVASAGGNRYYRLAHQIGMTLPPQPTACGRAMVAFMEPSVAERVARERGPDGRFLVDPKSWLKGLAEIRRVGLAFSHGELDSGLRAISAPIFGARNEVLAAITVVAPAHRLVPAPESPTASSLRRAAADISRELGCQAYPFPTDYASKRIGRKSERTRPALGKR